MFFWQPSQGSFLCVWSGASPSKQDCSPPWTYPQKVNNDFTEYLHFALLLYLFQVIICTLLLGTVTSQIRPRGSSSIMAGGGRGLLQLDFSKTKTKMATLLFLCHPFGSAFLIATFLVHGLLRSRVHPAFFREDVQQG